MQYYSRWNGGESRSNQEFARVDSWYHVILCALGFTLASMPLELMGWKHMIMRLKQRTVWRQSTRNPSWMTFGYLDSSSDSIQVSKFNETPICWVSNEHGQKALWKVNTGISRSISQNHNLELIESCVGRLRTDHQCSFICICIIWGVVSVRNDFLHDDRWAQNLKQSISRIHIRSSYQPRSDCSACGSFFHNPFCHA